MFNLFLIFLMLLLVSGCGPSKELSLPNSNVGNSYITKRISMEEYSSLISLNAKVLSIGSRDIFSEIGGRVSEINFANKANLASNDVILKVDCRDRNADLQKKKTIFSQRKNDYKIELEMQNKGYSSKNNLIDVKSVLDLAELDMQLSEINYDKCFIKTPDAGLLDYVLPSVGDLISPGQLIARVLDNRVKLLVYVSGKEMDMIDKDSTHLMKLDDSDHECRIENYDLSANDNGMYRFEILCDGVSGIMRFGHYVNVLLRAKNVHAYSIPSSAVFIDGSGRSVVKILENDNIVELPVDIISQNSNGDFWIHVNHDGDIEFIEHNVN